MTLFSAETRGIRGQECARGDAISATVEGEIAAQSSYLRCVYHAVTIELKNSREGDKS